MSAAVSSGVVIPIVLFLAVQPVMRGVLVPISPARSLSLSWSSEENKSMIFTYPSARPLTYYHVSVFLFLLFSKHSP